MLTAQLRTSLSSNGLDDSGWAAVVVGPLTSADFEVVYCPAVAAAAAAAGEDVLSWLSFGHTSIRKTLGSEARILAFYYW
jgi:hypothetical protein